MGGGETFRVKFIVKIFGIIKGCRQLMYRYLYTIETEIYVEKLFIDTQEEYQNKSNSIHNKNKRTRFLKSKIVFCSFNK